MGCTELCGDVNIKQRHMPRQIRIEFCANLSVSLSVSVTVSGSIWGRVNTLLHISWKTHEMYVKRFQIQN